MHVCSFRSTWQRFVMFTNLLVSRHTQIDHVFDHIFATISDLDSDHLVDDFDTGLPE